MNPADALRPTPTPRPELHEVLPPGCVELHAVGLDLHAEGDERRAAPEWVHIVPAGEVDDATGEHVVRGRDGRRFTIDSHEAVMAGSELPMQIDWEHLSVLGPSGGERATKAAGWIDRLEWIEQPDEQRPAPGLWAHVARWTPEGRADVEQGYYRGLSPVVRYQLREPAVEGDEPPPPLLRGVVNVALTNRPNLRMTLLHSEQHTAPRAPGGTGTMNEHEKGIRARLGLPETATHAEVARVALAQLDSLVPRADLEQALHRAQAAEAALHQLRQEQHAAEVRRAIDDARKAGKIAPASVPHYERMCATPEGLQAFRELVATLPSIVADDPHAARETQASSEQRALSGLHRQLAQRMGLRDEEVVAAMEKAREWGVELH